MPCDNKKKSFFFQNAVQKSSACDSFEVTGGRDNSWMDFFGGGSLGRLAQCEKPKRTGHSIKAERYLSKQLKI